MVIPTKLIIVAVMGVMAIALGGFVATCQLVILQREAAVKQLHNKVKALAVGDGIDDNDGSGVAANSNNNNNNNINIDDDKSDETNNNNNNSDGKKGSGKYREIRSRTVAATDSTKPDTVFLWKTRPEAAHSTHARVAADGYWRHYRSWLTTWGDASTVPIDSDQIDDHLHNLGAAGGDIINPNTLSTAAASVVSSSGGTVSAATKRDHYQKALLEAAALGNPDAQHHVAVALSSGIWLTGQQVSPVQEDFIVPDSRHTNQAYLYWHMAAMDGHTEAAAALGHRQLQQQADQCDAALPYYEAAAHAIVDELEVSPLSRGKINPSMDKHVLPQIHMHGGTSSQLEGESKPDETPEALQFYHILATRPEPDAHAAYVLGHLHHYGIRGATQNMTKAYFYYEIAANANHWEAAGQAGKFHVWNLGVTKRNLVKAKRFFEVGAPFGLQGCQRQYRAALSKKGNTDMDLEDTGVRVCDHPSLNGLGLLYLYGIPMVLGVDVQRAKQFFQLAHQMGNMDASYNLAMVRLGYKSSWKTLDEVPTKETSAAQDLNFKDNPNIPNESDIKDSVRELQSAASKGHHQARHRLGMIYSKGIRLPGSKTYTIKPDCKQALHNFKWVFNNASPILSQRTRTAYKHYMNGNLEASLQNYLMAAETGHTLSQVNAAFLFDQGVCLHLTPRQCRKASLRLWKAAAQVGDEEAALRVGDSYYYGSKQQSGILQAILFPEKHLLPWMLRTLGLSKPVQSVSVQETTEGEAATTATEEKESSSSSSSPSSESPTSSPSADSPTCAAGSEQGPDGTCTAVYADNDTVYGYDDSDHSKAAHYYRLAAERFRSPRAHFNLGFMHEWGLGLTQDFPLAKRHYDLAAAQSRYGEADLAVQLALWSMNIHQSLVKLQVAYTKWNRGTAVPVPHAAGQAAPPARSPMAVKTKTDVIVNHLWSWESLLILILTIVLSMLFQYRRQEQPPRPQ